MGLNVTIGILLFAERLIRRERYEFIMSIEVTVIGLVGLNICIFTAGLIIGKLISDLRKII